MRDRRAAVPYLVATLEENVCVKSQCFIDCRCPYLFAISTDWSMNIDELIAHCVCLCYNAPASWDSYNYAYNWPCRIHSYRATSNPNQIAAVLTAKGRIAAATYRITSAHAWYSLYFTIGLYVSPRKKNCASPGGIRAPCGSRVLRKFTLQTASRSVQPFRHRSRLWSHTDHATFSNSPHLCTANVRCHLKILNFIAFKTSDLRGPLYLRLQ